MSPDDLDRKQDERLNRTRADERARAQRTLDQTRTQARKPQPQPQPRAQQKKQPSRIKTGAQRIGNVAKKAAPEMPQGRIRGGGAALALGATGAQTAQTPTETYYKRFGIEPRNDGTITGDLLPNIGIRTLGAASDLADAATFGVAGNLFYRDRQPVIPGENQPQQPPVSRPQGQSAGGMRPGAQSGAQQGNGANKPQRTAKPSGGAIQRNGNTFSDQQIAGGADFTPAGGGLAASTAQPGRPTTAQRLRQSGQRREARQANEQAQIERRRTRSTQQEQARATRRQNQQERANMMRMLKANANGGPGVSARMQREAQTMLAQMAGNNEMPEVMAPQSPEEAQALALRGQEASQQAMLAQQQQTQQGFANEREALQTDVMRQLQNIGSLSPEQRQNLVDRALVMQGESPSDAQGSFSLSTLQGGPSDPEQAVVLNERTGEYQLIGQGAGGGGAQGQPTPTPEEFIAVAQNDPNYRGLSREQILAAYRRFYGDV